MDISSKSGLKYLSKKYEIHPRKKWGQNFLMDKNILNKIAESCGLNSENYVLEIGPGLGALTQYLGMRSKGVLAVEIDYSLEQALNESLADINNCKIKFADILKIDIETEMKSVFNLQEIPTYKVCANIPYNITTPIIFKLLENCSHMDDAVLMIQKEVARRLNSQTDTKEYGLLTIMVQYYADIEYLMDVSQNCFFPRPEVDSAVIRITPHRRNDIKAENELLFKNLVKTAFQMRRKTMLNVCAKFYNLDKEKIKYYLNLLDINPKSRPENLTINNFLNIADNMPCSK